MKRAFVSLMQVIFYSLLLYVFLVALGMFVHLTILAVRAGWLMVD